MPIVEAMVQTAEYLDALGHAALASKFRSAAATPPHDMNLTPAELHLLSGLTLPQDVYDAVSDLLGRVE